MTTRIAVIPARGGSTRLKNKNIFSLDGKPLIRWITEAVIRSESFDKIVISTDDDKIFNAVSDLDVVRHIRPANHATTKATALNAMLNLMQDEEKHVVSITEMPEPIQKACLVKNDWVIPVFDNLTAGLTNSKFIQKYHTPTGAFYISWWDKLLKNKNFFKGQVKGVIIPKHRSVDIDDIVDIKTAEAILER